MAVSGDQRERQQDGQHDDVGGLSPYEQSSFDQIARGAGESSGSLSTGDQARLDQIEAGERGAQMPSGGGQPQRGGGLSTPRVNLGGRRGGEGVPAKHLQRAEEGSGAVNHLGGRANRGAQIATGGVGSILGAEKKGDSNTPFSYTGGEGGAAGAGGAGGFMGKAKGFFQKHKKKIIAGGLAGAGVIPLIALLLFILAALKIPNFMENMAAWRFARLTQAYRESVNNVVGEKTALDTLDDAEAKAAEGKYGKYQMFDKINRLRPNKIMQALEGNDRLQYNYKTTFTGRQKLVSVTIATAEDAGSKLTVNVPSGKFDKIIHPFRTMDQYKTISSALDDAMKAFDPKIPGVVRMATTKALISDIGGSLSGLVASKFAGQNQDQLQLQLNTINTQLTQLGTQVQGYMSQQSAINRELARVQKAGGADGKTAGQLLTQWTDLEQKINAALGASGDVSQMSGLLDEWSKLSSSVGTLLKRDTSALTKSLSDASGNYTSLLEQKATIQSKMKGATEISDTEAKVALQQEVYGEVKDPNGVNGASNSDLKDLEKQVNDATDKCMADATCATQEVNAGGGTPDPVAQIVDDGLNPGSAKSMVEDIVGFVNPIYQIALPVCMVYDGSKISADTLDAQSNAMQREALVGLSTGDQQKDGTTYTRQAANAMNWKMGNTSESYVMQRAQGKPVDTTQSPNGQRTILGTYGESTIFDIFFGPGNPINGVADDICPIATNIWVGVGVGVASLIAAILSDGASEAGGEAAAQGARVAVQRVLDKYVTKIVENFTLKGVVRAFAQGGRFAAKQAWMIAKFGATIAATTFLAKYIVMQQAGQFSNGLETDTGFDNNMDNGADQLSTNMYRSNFYGRPLTNAESAASDNSDNAEQAGYNAAMSPYQRYASLANPNSLLNRMVVTTGSLFERSTFSGILNGMATVFNPIGLTSHLFASANSTAVAAAGTQNTVHYGNLVFGYSQEEKYLMTNNDTYSSVLENDKILEDSGQEDYINQKYNKCFDPSVSTNHLLADGSIKRDGTGDVLNGTDCAPDVLGPHSTDSKLKSPDLIFRYRLKHRYSNTVDWLSGVQDPQSTGATTNGTQGIALGIVPASGMEVGATTYGGGFDSSTNTWYSSNNQQGGRQPYDDNGMGNDGKPLAGRTAYAELGGGTALGHLPNGTKLQITYKGTVIVAEKDDVGAGGAPINGKPRAVDLWWQTAKLLGLTDGSDVISIKVVPQNTPVTPVQ